MADEDGVWRTISGRKVFIKDGQSVSDAMKSSGKFNIKTKKQKNEYSNKDKAIEAAYEKQQNNKNTTYEVFEKDGKYYVDGGTNESGKFSWLNTSRWYREHGYNKLPDSDYKKWMKMNKEKK